MRYDYCATIGFFDGVHRGHQFMIDSLTEMAHARGRQSLVITFDRHPRQVVHADYIPQLITTADEKLQLLKATAADRIEVLHFDTEMAQLSAYEFMRRVLHEKYGVALLLTGYIIHDIGLKNVRLDRDLGIAMVFRFLLAPTLSVALCRAFGVTGLAHDVLVVETAMPVVTQTVVAAAEYGADEQLAAQGAAISTLACFVVTPVLMLLL